jgi:scyllo-inositol 2-dehydrogenase (NADP+)
VKKIIESGKLGNIYSIKMFYGNGTARLVKNSKWRDKGYGVLPDLGSHLLDTINFWLGPVILKNLKLLTLINLKINHMIT